MKLEDVVKPWLEERGFNAKGRLGRKMRFVGVPKDPFIFQNNCIDVIDVNTETGQITLDKLGVIQEITSEEAKAIYAAAPKDITIYVVDEIIYINDGWRTNTGLHAADPEFFIKLEKAIHNEA